MSARDTEYMALIPKAQEDLRYGRYLMDDPTGEAPGTIVVDTKERFLYFVLPDKKVIRYGVAVGDEAYGWTGVSRVARKAEWPDWNPPAEMMARWPHVIPPKAAPTIRWAPARCISMRATRIRSIASMAPTSRKRSA